eukprot:CFRG0737T1
MSFIAKTIPTLLTLGALSAGLSAVRLSFEGDFSTAFFLLFASAILDGLDGHAARALGTASAFGAELDSLCDLVDFGVSPALVMFLWCWNEYKDVDNLVWYESVTGVWMACLFYAGCCACRLARFNLTVDVPAPMPPHSTHFLDEEEDWEEEELAEVDARKMRNRRNSNADTGIKQRRSSIRSSLLSTDISPDVSASTSPLPTSGDAGGEFKWLDAYVNRTKFFEGVPAPAAAYLMLMPLVYTLVFGSYNSIGLHQNTVVLGTFFTVGCLMMSSLRMFSSKMLIKGPIKARDPHTSHFRSRSVWTFLLKVFLVAFTIYLFVVYPWVCSLALGVLYAFTLPIGPVCYKYFLTDTHVGKEH